MNVHVLIPAAGAGRRMGGDVSKQYLSLSGRPILAHTVALFEAHPAISRIVLVAPDNEIEYCRTEIVERYGFAKVAAIVAGGAERQDSVRNGLRACAAAEEDIVLIHDGVRPLLEPAQIDAVIAAAAENGAALLGVPAKDTVKIVERGVVRDTPERQTVWLAQTPQAFRYGTIARAHEKALAEGCRATDDAQLVEWVGDPVSMVEGSYRNLKITTPEDLALAEAVLSRADEETQ